MITKTQKLDSAYEELFNEIRDRSDNAINIDNIEGFFGNIREIKELDKKYLRLPLDEPLFEIDANSRKITIPNEFRSNGLSVQNDHLAETVFFSIDRYFDYMDLSNTDITINWKMGSEIGKTKNFIMSTEIVPGKIIFGWPVNNTVTKKSGSLTFAVEFCKKDENTGAILYDFNTLAASITIKDGLVIGDVEVVTLDNNILNILDNSQFGTGDAAVGDVTWLTGKGHGLVRNSGAPAYFVPEDYVATIDLPTTVDNGVPSSTSIDLFAEGFVDAGTEIKYIDVDEEHPITLVTLLVPITLTAVEAGTELDNDIVYYLANNSKASANDLSKWGTEDAVPLFKAAALAQNRKYYVSTENPVLAYVPASDEQIAAWGTENQVALYVKLAKITASEAGSYIVKAQGQKFVNNNKVGAGATAITDSVIVPEAQAPSSIEIIASSIEAPSDNYSFDETESANVVFLNNGIGSLTASAVVDSFGALQFVWQKKIGEDTDFSNDSEEEVPYIYENNSALTVRAEGEYRVIVKNFKNGIFSKAITSDKFIASELAGEITNAQTEYRLGSTEFSAVNGPVEYNSAGIQAQKSITLRVNVNTNDINGPIGTLSYEWYKKTGIGESGPREFISNKAELIISSGDGQFIPVVKNNYNGSIFTLELDPVSVNDIANG